MPQHPAPAHASTVKATTPAKTLLSLPIPGARMFGERETTLGEVKASSIITLHNVTNRAVGSPSKRTAHRPFSTPRSHFLPLLRHRFATRLLRVPPVACGQQLYNDQSRISTPCTITIPALPCEQLHFLSELLSSLRHHLASVTSLLASGSHWAKALLFLGCIIDLGGNRLSEKEIPL